MIEPPPAFCISENTYIIPITQPLRLISVTLFHSDISMLAMVFGLEIPAFVHIIKAIGYFRATNTSLHSVVLSSHRRFVSTKCVMRTRQMLRDALVELIHEQGYEKITVQDIAKRATQNRATFYLHYRDKLDLLEQSSQEILLDLVESMNLSYSKQETFDIHSEQPHDKFVYLFEHISQNAKLYKVFLSEKNMPYTSKYMATQLLRVAILGPYADNPFIK